LRKTSGFVVSLSQSVWQVVDAGLIAEAQRCSQSQLAVHFPDQSVAEAAVPSPAEAALELLVSSPLQAIRKTAAITCR
jgi:hypothetical protein